MYKVGDRVRVTYVDALDSNVYEGDIFKVIDTDTENHVRVNTKGHNYWPMRYDQIEKVEESKEMTFPEMAQKLIDGEFEVGTELINSYEFYEKSYWVHQSENTGNFGLSVSKYEDILKVELEGTDINGLWTVKEEIKEMSFEELQKELGYKIKITE